MPHSSGGGSSSGSSHSGGSSSSGGGNGENIKISDEYFPGATRYRRRDNTYYYSNGGKYGGGIGFLVFGIIWLVFTVPLVFTMVATPSKAKLPDVMYDDAIVIADAQDLMSDAEEAALEQELNQFLKETNISVAIETVDPTDVPSTLENYAYGSYVSRFDDEYHWLIVFSEKNSDETIYFEGMQGDDTDPVLTSAVTGKFNKDVAQKLKETRNVKESLSYGFSSMTLKDGISLRSNLNEGMRVIIIACLFAAIGLFALIRGIRWIINGIGAKEG